MEKGSFSLNRHNGPPPSRLGPLNPMQFEWSINTPSAGDGQKTSCTFAFRDQSFTFDLCGPTTVIFTMPTARSPRVIADVYTLTEGAVEPLEALYDDQAPAMANTPYDTAVDQAIEHAVDIAVKDEATDSASVNWEERSPDCPLDVDENAGMGAEMVEHEDFREQDDGYDDEDDEDDDDDSDASSELVFGRQPDPDSDDLLIDDNDPPFFYFIMKKKFRYKLTPPWLMLALRIQDWLAKLVRDHDEHPLLQWGIELFWISFVGAYPDFPYGIWPTWNGYAAPFEGAFLTSWLKRPRGEHPPDDVRQEMWDELTYRVISYYGGVV